MKTLKNILILSTLALFLATACEKVIDIELPNSSQKLVVEGEINTFLPAIVTLSRSMSYFSTIDSSTFSNIFVTDTNALVIVSDGIINDTLTLQQITRFPYMAYVGSRILGQENTAYTLNIQYEGKEYYATTTIPESPDFSSIWYEPEYRNDSIGMLAYSFFDDATTQDHYYASSLTIGEQLWYYAPMFGSPIFYDRLVNGDSVIVQLTKGYTGNAFFSPEVESPEEWDSIIYFSPGDAVSLRLSTIDEDFFLWWNSLIRASFSGSNPYSNPSSVRTNIEGDPALGVWGGYANTIANVYISDSGTVEELTLDYLIDDLLTDSMMTVIYDLLEDLDIDTSEIMNVIEGELENLF